MTNINIENIVASAHIAEELDIERLSKGIPDSKYNPKGFPGLILHFEKPKTAAQDVIEAIEEAVIESFSINTFIGKTHGLSILSILWFRHDYVPDVYLELDFAKDTAWDELLSEFKKAFSISYDNEVDNSQQQNADQQSTTTTTTTSTATTTTDQSTSSQSTPLGSLLGGQSNNN